MNVETKHFVATLLTHDDPDARRHAAEALAASGGLTPIAALAAALRDENKGVRDAVARALCAIGGPNVARAIVEQIANENIVTRNLAAELLQKLGKISVEALVPYLHDKNQDVRKIAVDVLGAIKDPAPVRSILALCTDPDPNVVVSAVEALGNIRSSLAVNDLCALFDRQESARPPIAEALGKIKDNTSSAFLLRKLREACGNPTDDPLTFFALIDALGEVGDEEALSAMRDQVEKARGTIRSALLQAIERIARRLERPVALTPELKQNYLAALSDADMNVCLSAAKTLSPIVEADVTCALVGSLGRFQELDQEILATLLARGEGLRSTLEALEQGGCPRTKSVIGILARLALEFTRTCMRPGMVNIDEELLSNTFEVVARQWDIADEETRATIVDALFRLDGDRAIEFLDRIMNDPDPWLRMHVIELLMAIDDRRAPEFIARFLGDDDEMVREVASETLRARGYEASELGGSVR